MKLLDRYILSEIVPPFLVGVASFVVLIVGHLLYQIVGIVIENRIPLRTVAEYVTLQVPNALILAIPVSTLLAVALGINRLSREAELPALRMAGAGSFRLMAPAALFGLLASAGSLYVSEYVQPQADRRARQIQTTMAIKAHLTALRPRQFVQVADQWALVAEHVEPGSGVVQGLQAYKLQPGILPLLLQAERATVSDRGVVIENGQVWVMGLPNRGDVTEGPVARTTIAIRELGGTSGGAGLAVENMTVRELAVEARRAPTPQAAGQSWFRLHARLALALASLVFALAAGPVAFAFRGGQAIVGVLAALIVGFVYYLGMLWAPMLSRSLPPALAAWAEDVVLAGLALLVLWRLR